jgi:hypothetical protein
VQNAGKVLRHIGFEQGAFERVILQFFCSRKETGKARIGDIKFRRLEQSACFVVETGKLRPSDAVRGFSLFDVLYGYF